MVVAVGFGYSCEREFSAFIIVASDTRLLNKREPITYCTFFVSSFCKGSPEFGGLGV